MATQPLLAILGIQPNQVKIDQIVCNPTLTTEHVGIHGLVAPDAEKIAEYLDIFQRSGTVAEIFKLWNNDGELILLDNYEGFEAAKRFLESSTQRQVNVFEFELGSFVAAKEISNRLRELRGGNNSYWERLFNLSILLQIPCDQATIFRMYGIKKKKSSRGKMLDRDYRLVRCEKLFKRVMGSSQLEKLSNSSIPVNKPHPVESTLSYSLALNVLRILKNKDSYVDDFDRKYEDYLSQLRQNYKYPDEEVKPIYKWKNYSKQRVVAIATSCSKVTQKVSVSLASDSEDMIDRAWRPKVSKTTYDLTLPSFRVDLAKKDDSNVKKIVDLKYKLETLSHSLESYIKRIRPASHGKPVRLSNDTTEPNFDTRGNTPKYEDSGYFEYIRKHKLLYYCNRESLLKSLRLKAHFFSFSSYRHDETKIGRAHV